jgi:hypothetical protein
MNDDIENTKRQIRSFGCNGPNHRNERRCRLHCRSEKYKSGSCSPFTNFQVCVCSGSPISKSRDMEYVPVFLNINR